MWVGDFTRHMTAACFASVVCCTVCEAQRDSRLHMASCIDDMLPVNSSKAILSKSFECPRELMERFICSSKKRSRVSNWLLY